MIITIARECGSSGYEIGLGLAQKLNIEFYDKEKMITQAKKSPYYEEYKDFFEETPMNSLLYGIAMGMGQSTMQSKAFEFVRQMTKGKSFVIIGRCSNYIFRDNPEAVTVFIHADRNLRIEKVKRISNLSDVEAMQLIKNTDKKRKEFHNYCTDEIWGEGRNYDLCIDSGMLGVENSIEMIECFINKKIS